MILFCDDVSGLSSGSRKDVLVYCFGCNEYRLKRFYAAIDSRTGLCKECSALFSSKSKFIGKTFNRLTILDLEQSESRSLYAICVCECGEHKKVRLREVREGIIKSCGCLNKELSSKRMSGLKGKLHPSWNTKYSDEERLEDYFLRRSSSYRSWREAVLNRDFFECQKCGIDTDLEVHHIIGFKNNKDVALDLNNGITLCKSCHTNYHISNGGFKAEATKESFEEWFNDN